jgi:hypothetical protein
MKREFSWLLLGSAMAVGCQHDDNSFDYVGTTDQLGDPAAKICLAGDRCSNDQGVSLAEGSVASAHVVFLSHSNNALSGGAITSADSTVLQVLSATTDSSRYVFLGVSVGKTSLSVSLNGQPIETVPVTVFAPPASSLPPMLNGGPDLPVPEAGPPDAGLPAVDTMEASVADAEAADVGPADATLPDVAVTDAGAAEASTPEASASDAVATSD